jgi:hypothetical protein
MVDRTYLCLPLAQYGIRCSSPCRRRTPAYSRSRPVLGNFRIATCVVYPVPNLDGILPYPVLDFLRPRWLKRLLTNGTGRVAQSSIIGSPDPLLRRAFLG